MQIISGRIKKPWCIVVFGVPGIGKTALGCGWVDQNGVEHLGAPEPLIIGAEENDEVETARLAKCTDFAMFNRQLDWIISEKPKYKTLIVDTIDSIEKLLHGQLLSADPKAKGSMNAAYGGYGKAYEMAEREMILVRDKLTYIRDVLGMNIMILAHSKKVQGTDTILGMNHDTYELTLHQRVQNVFIDWASAVLFATYVTYFKEDENSDKMFATGNGERVLLTEKRPGHQGKNRFTMPYKIPLDFKSFEEHYDNFFAGKLDPEEIKKNIMGGCELLTGPDDAKIVSKIITATGEAGDDIKQLQAIHKRVLELTGSK